ncbi:MAG: hypothetical protein IJI52_07540, partial [Solobacterium sp.]|nr:hypothetical protein [Solobacterium sp.]
KVMEELGIPQPKGLAVTDIEEGVRVAEEIGYPVLVRPSFVLGGRAMQIVASEESLSFRFTEELLPPFCQHAQLRFIADEHFRVIALLFQDPPADGITVSVIDGKIIRIQFPAGICVTLQNLIRVNAHQGHRQQADGSNDGITTADIIRNDKRRIAHFVRQGLERPPGLIGCRENPLRCFFSSVCLFHELPQHTESQGSLGGCAGLGDDVQQNALSFQMLQHLGHVCT